MSCDRDPLNRDLRAAEITARTTSQKLDACEREFLAQRAKSTHLNLSDKCNKYFHSLIKRRNARNTISFIRRDDGTTSGDINTIISDFVHFYSDLFGKSVGRTPIDWSVFDAGPKLSSEDHDILIAQVTPLEIKEALNLIGDDKAPGPDGYPSAFFKRNWEIVGEDVIAAVNEFFSKGLIFRKLNHTIVSLIPKTSHDPGVSDFRPIACTNVVYKIVTKIIAKRMSPFLLNLISPAQAAFIKGRSITDNYFLAQELIKKYERKSGITARGMVKLDLRKAYDCISWDFLRDVLQGLNFHPCFIYWIMTCVTSATFSIAINGGSHGFIRGQRGLRQGDPMSPTLFLFCMEYLSRLLYTRTHHTDFAFHPKCDVADITHLAFADDLLLFGRGDPRSMEILKDAMDDFTAASGLSINKSKSNIFLGGVRQFEKQQILDMFGFLEGSLPVIYLGLPLASRGLRCTDYSPLLTHISGFIHRWSNSFLSRAGRLELVRSVLQGVECFWLQALPLPATVIDRITKLLRRFLWGSAFCPVAWKQVCLPREEGGLGLRELSAWNKALLSKVLWNIHAKTDSLWIRWVHGEYIRDGSVWDVGYPKRDATLFKNILSIRDTIILDCGGDVSLAQTKLVSWFDGTYKGTKEAYEHFRAKGEKLFWHKAIWRPFIPPKFSVTLWLAIQGRLKTVDRLKHSDIPRRCFLCDAADETHEHLFFQCPKTVVIWDGICSWLNIQNRIPSIKAAIRKFQRDKAGSGILRKAKWIALAVTVSFVWHVRNLRYTEGKVQAPSVTIKEIKTDVFRVLYSLFPADAVMSHMDINTR